MTKSEEWDQREKADENNRNVYGDAFYNAMKIYRNHQYGKSCFHVKIGVNSAGEFYILKCKDCGWNYFKKNWWEFWK